MLVAVRENSVPVLPPSIPGLTYKGFLGSGGFADVFLYESASPVRNVAVKVLRDKNLSQQWVRRFTDEANAMAALEHPYIATIHSSGLTDDGRPYIEMAYYPNDSLAQAVTKGPLPVAEVLRIGVHLASAIAAAHQVGLIHRDIKPSNVLIDRFGDPALTDFGIASHLHQADSGDSSLSVPWAPPEAIFTDAPLDRRGDIYSLAATLWHLLVGHAPFEWPGGDNRSTTMMVRVRDLPAPATGRGDVPQSLDRLLRQGLSKDPRLRPATAEDFARALNAVEEELRLRPTPFKVARPTVPTPTPSPVNQNYLTHLRPAIPVTEWRGPMIQPVAHMAQAPKPTTPRNLLIALGSVVVLLVVAAIGTWAWFKLGPGSGPTPTPSITATPSVRLTPTPSPTVQPTPTPIASVLAVGDCLSMTPLSLDESTYMAWSVLEAARVSCDGAEAYVRIIAVHTHETFSSSPCSTDEACYWFSSSEFAASRYYYYNPIPQLGVCFYGFVNTAYPDKGDYGAYGWPRIFGQCGSTFPSFIDVATVAANRGLDESDLQRTEFQIVTIGESGLECEYSQGSWDITFSPGTQTGLCVTETAI